MQLRDPDFARLAELVAAHTGRREPLQLHAMPGGASTRRYYRVDLGDGHTAVAMFVPEGGKPEEIQKGSHAARWPFLEVRELLAERGVDVPALYGEDTDAGWLLLEDLSDDTLANFLLRAPEKKTALYQRAVAELAEAQRRLADLPAGSVVRTRAFDEDLLLWEIDHFREWGLEARGVQLADEDRTHFDAIARRLAKRIAAWPRGFVHRDYQSRNLMVRTNRAGEPTSLCWLDFQDALLGPRIYDLVALLNDSYQEFDRPFVEARLDEFARGLGLDRGERERLSVEFDLMTVQRKLKDAGRFVFIDKVKHNPGFLRFVAPTVRKVALSLERLAPVDEDMRALLGVLRRALPDEVR
jgi:aminoglycoside/choline kinase family phosphotransferase